MIRMASPLERKINEPVISLVYKCSLRENLHIVFVICY